MKKIIIFLSCITFILLSCLIFSSLSGDMGISSLGLIGSIVVAWKIKNKPKIILLLLLIFFAIAITIGTMVECGVKFAGLRKAQVISIKDNKALLK
ncbi:MAG: hypothetical protein WCI77_06295 [Candidatus Omnitrophota bacterium]